jgi:hypothetical protein
MRDNYEEKGERMKTLGGNRKYFAVVNSDDVDPEMHKMAPELCPYKRDEWLNPKRRPQ